MPGRATGAGGGAQSAEPRVLQGSKLSCSNACGAARKRGAEPACGP